ncbi:fibrobacter succinogenes major paralogous domain-containing protein [uncultured Fibrobacter sp.]|uniref:fibrobacter succinogenes major paralogous domain-containing protein n=1 Tax=uncultured Fibrobacter sp. TaxID=261512 RepID=UPI0025E870D3|nr:fibrobacter succinogenes major paralogous domain-containing protein [uncultured Fibrobacter sp.]
MNRNFGTRFIPACALAAMAVLTACSDKQDVAGGASGDMGIVAKDIVGEALKGPFVKGSAVTVQGIDCKTMKFSDEVFEGKVKSDKGDFAFDDVTLSSTCAVFEATGKYRSEITGKESAGEITLHALTDLKDRKNVNINLLTELEYERVMYLVTEKGKTFADAKDQAEKEVLAAFGIAGDFDNSEDLTIYESGDGNAALLAVSVLMHAETDVAGLGKRVEKFADSFAETGKWSDGETKAAIEEWQVAATADGTLDSIRKNVEGWGYADVVPAFEKYIEVFGDTVILSSDSHQSSSSTPVEDLSSSSAKTNAGSEYDATANTLKDLRDGQVYKTVKIGNQVWMAENLNFETDSSFCYRDSAYFCAMHGRLYKWTAAVDACPSGWHLPSKAEFESLIATVGEDSTAGKVLKSASGWSSGGNGSDDFGFAALPAGDRGHDGGYSGAYFLAFFWSSTEINDNNVFNMYLTFNGDSVHQSVDIKDMGNSVRCVKDDGTVPESSSSSVASSSSRSDNRTVSYKMTRPIAFLDTVNRRYYYVDDHCAYDRDNDKYKWVQGDAPKGIVSYDLDDYAVGGQPGGIYFLGYKISNDTLYKCHVYTNSCDEPNYANVYVGNSGSFLGTWKSVSQLPSGLLRSVTNRDVELTVSPESFTFQVSYTVPPFYYTSEHCTLIYYITGDNDFNTKCLAIFKNANYPNTDIADTVHVTDDIWIAKKGVDGVVTSINGKIIESRFSYAFDPDTYKEELYRTTNYNGIECSYNSKMIEVVKSKELCEELDPDVYNHDDKFEYSNFSEFESCYSQYGF